MNHTVTSRKLLIAVGLPLANTIKRSPAVYSTGEHQICGAPAVMAGSSGPSGANYRWRTLFPVRQRYRGTAGEHCFLFACGSMCIPASTHRALYLLLIASHQALPLLLILLSSYLHHTHTRAALNVQHSTHPRSPFSLPFSSIPFFPNSPPPLSLPPDPSQPASRGHP